MPKVTQLICGRPTVIIASRAEKDKKRKKKERRNIYIRKLTGYYNRTLECTIFEFLTPNMP